jgi:hypothetical protein
MLFTTVYATNYKTRVFPSFFKDVYSNRKGTYIEASQEKIARVSFLLINFMWNKILNWLVVKHNVGTNINALK